MRIIEPSFSLHAYGQPLTPEIGVQLLRWIEFNARISHRSEEAHTETSWEKFLGQVIISKGDWSVAEHSSVTAIVRTDRGITHEIVRHRIGSYTQESTRFVNGQKKYDGDLEFIRPTALAAESEWYWKDSVHLSEKNYLDMLENHVRPQEARSVLPNCLAATISCTFNLRNWRHFLLMRCSRESHPDMRRITIPLLAEMQRCIPLLYADIIPEQRQIDNLKLPR